jgi:small GTP-binding protein
MGNSSSFIGNLCQPYFENRRILMIGLDNAGKSTILYKLKSMMLCESERSIDVIPTIGFNVETVNYQDTRFTVWDIGGNDKIRSLWNHYYYHTDVLIFVIDSADVNRISEAKDELFKILQNDLLNNVPLLVIANKQDIKQSISTDRMIQMMNLNSLTDRKWRIQTSCAVTGHGLFEIIDWISIVSNNKKTNNLNKSYIGLDQLIVMN